jgi:hypothetical protein
LKRGQSTPCVGDTLPLLVFVVVAVAAAAAATAKPSHALPPRDGAATNGDEDITRDKTIMEACLLVSQRQFATHFLLTRPISLCCSISRNRLRDLMSKMIRVVAIKHLPPSSAPPRLAWAWSETVWAATTELHSNQLREKRSTTVSPATALAAAPFTDSPLLETKACRSFLANSRFSHSAISWPHCSVSTENTNPTKPN